MKEEAGKLPIALLDSGLQLGSYKEGRATDPGKHKGLGEVSLSLSWRSFEGGGVRQSTSHF